MAERRTQTDELIGKLIELNKIDKRVVTLFNEQRVTTRRQTIVLNSNIPVSAERDITSQSANGGGVTREGAEYKVFATSATNSIGVLETVQNGLYIAGNISEAGLGVRPVTLPVDDQWIKWGIYEKDSGTGDRTGGYFELNSEGLFAVLEDEGVEVHRRAQNLWVLDTFNGLNILAGQVYQIAYGYYGYLPFIWEISKEASFNPNSITPGHYFKREDNVSVSNPNLPITVEAFSGTSGQALDVYVGGRQYTTYGEADPQGRPESISASNAAVGTTFEPLIAVKSKATFTQIVKYFDNLDIVSDGRGFWRIVVGDAPTGGSAFGPIGNKYDPNETSVEIITDATTIGSNTRTIASGIFTGNNNADVLAGNQLPERELNNQDVYTLELAAEATTVDVLVNLGIRTIW